MCRSQVARHADRRFEGIVDAHSSDDERLERGFSQPPFKVGPDERALVRFAITVSLAAGATSALNSFPISPGR